MLLKIMYSRTTNDLRIAWQFELSTFLEVTTLIDKLFIEPFFLVLEL